MKKIVPDPPQDLARRFELPAGMSLSTAILEGLVPIEEVLSNACHFMLFAYNDTVQGYEATQELTVKQTLVESLRSIELVLGQLDALVTALKRQPDSAFHTPTM